METYTVKIRTAGQKVIHRRKQVRTPVVFNNVTKEELLFLESQARSLRLIYELKKESEIENEFKIDDVVGEETLVPTDEVIIEELEPQKEPSTILEKLISEEKK
jgi:hypothetical protein